MTRKIGKENLGRASLFGAALIWGSSFLIMKQSVDVFPTHLLLGLRFSLGLLVLAAIFFKKLRRLQRTTVLRGMGAGLLLFLAYSVQTLGLITTTPGKNAFLTAVYCVVVPFLNWAITKKRPDLYNWSAGALCLCGIGFVSLTGNLTISTGDGLTLLGGFFFSIHMVAVSHWGRSEDPVLFTMCQFAMAALCSFAVFAFTEKLPSAVPGDAWLSLLYLAVFATAGALLLQNIGQKYTNPMTSALLLSLESVFGVLFSVIMGAESLTPRLLVGFALIFVSIVLSETKLAFLRRKPLTEK